MYARVAHFEGADTGRIDEQVADMRRQIEATRSGELPPDAPAGMETLNEVVTRLIQLVDRESGSTAAIIFCDSADDMRRADEALNEMSPPGPDDGRRVSVGVYEGAIDENFR